jgi:uncharacterized protein (DUF924 family)
MTCPDFDFVSVLTVWGVRISQLYMAGVLSAGCVQAAFLHDDTISRASKSFLLLPYSRYEAIETEFQSKKQCKKIQTCRVSNECAELHRNMFTRF